MTLRSVPTYLKVLSIVSEFQGPEPHSRQWLRCDIKTHSGRPHSATVGPCPEVVLSGFQKLQRNATPMLLQQWRQGSLQGCKARHRQQPTSVRTAVASVIQGDCPITISSLFDTEIVQKCLLPPSTSHAPWRISSPSRWVSTSSERQNPPPIVNLDTIAAVPLPIRSPSSPSSCN